ncbi:unnamed protein product [Durusdinium trenchii]|uniref:Uncharacterized protein n=1 Tax=Durusdinium trenchii TaxID=1381693 RepID=A0ABP0L0R8_9DINO
MLAGLLPDGSFGSHLTSNLIDGLEPTWTFKASMGDPFEGAGMSFFNQFLPSYGSPRRCTSRHPPPKEANTEPGALLFALSIVAQLPRKPAEESYCWSIEEFEGSDQSDLTIRK